MAVFPTNMFLARVRSAAGERSQDAQGDAMEIGLGRRMPRRGVLGLMGTGMAGFAARPAFVPNQHGVAVSRSAATGVGLLRSFYLLGELPVAPTSALPGLHWGPYASGALVFEIPDGWSGAGAPSLVDPTRGLIDIEAVATVAPRASAAWMTFLALSLSSGTADQAAAFGLTDLARALFQSPAKPTVISVERNELAGATVTFAVARWGTMLAVARGGSHVSGSDLIFYDAMAAPESRFTAMTRSVFLPLIYEHIGGGGRGATPAA